MPIDELSEKHTHVICNCGHRAGDHAVFGAHACLFYKGCSCTSFTVPKTTQDFMASIAKFVVDPLEMEEP